MNNKYKKAMAEALVDGWQSSSSMTQVIMRAWMLMDLDPPEGKQFFEIVGKSLGERYVDMKQPAKAWIAGNVSTLNEMLWAGRTRDACIAHALKLMGMKRMSSQYSVTKTRERDKAHDWNTVK